MITMSRIVVSPSGRFRPSDMTTNDRPPDRHRSKPFFVADRPVVGRRSRGPNYARGGDKMPEKKTRERAQRAKRQGKSASTQAGEYVREEIHHVREGKHGARSSKQAIAIGLSKARRAGVKVGRPKRGSQATKRKAAQDAKRGSSSPSRKRSRATTKALRREGRSAASKRSLSRQASSAARRRTASERSAAARKAARTKGARTRSAAAKKAARTRARSR
jgi:hypothetical protein